MNTHSNLKYLHDKTQANVDSTSSKAVKQAPEATTSKPLRHSSNAKFAQKMKMLFLTKKAKSQASDEECEATVNERKRSTMAQLVGSHAVVQMGRR
ncbi:Hypothetical protein PHPALM_10832 [Phytophthora palmivora]|uniref:Uncharacterized protein n=1 Tax=Phytophthora palmivora TaxID=4796 RepID=A0A2P4Y3S3_9STRA|nr:Hypothetical protein PHPALM_10832 [Phytophthora palmivora]